MKTKPKILLWAWNIFAIVLGGVIEIWLTKVGDTVYFPIHFFRLLLVELVTIGITNALYFQHKKIGDIAFRYRYAIGGILIVLCTIVQINGSSIGGWENMLTGNNQFNQGVLLGRTREIRTDEWNVNTMMSFSKYHDDYSYFSQVTMGGGADNFIVYGQPVKDIGTIFRPFLIGYLFLTQGQGLSFFWCARLIVLLLVSFEMMLLLTKRKKLLSLVGAVMITLAPVVQWWFAINGLVEMLIFGQLAVILLAKFMKQEKRGKRLLYLIGMAICAGGYGLTFYPAWQIPLIYVFLALAIWVIITNKDKFSWNKQDTIQLLSVLLVLGLIGIHIFMQSKDTIKTVLNTVYPGQRAETGGGMIYALSEYSINPFFSMKETGVPANVCEDARFFDLFPLSFILVAMVLIRQSKEGKKKDTLLILLTIASSIIGYFCIFGMPQLISKITLLSFSTATRAYLAFGFANVLILIRAFSLLKTELSIKQSILLTTLMTLFTGMQVATHFLSYTGNLGLMLICVMIFTLCYLMVRKKETLFAITMILIMFFSGALVNPVRIGADVVFQAEISKAIQEIVKQDKEATWIYEGIGFPNILIANGAKTINSTNVYPQLELWHQLDQNKQYEDVYNRYAHIGINVQNTEETKFQLATVDSFVVSLNQNDLAKLKVKYILTRNELKKLESETIQYQERYTNNYFYIYEVK